jgi:hypothetical protein
MVRNTLSRTRAWRSVKGKLLLTARDCYQAKLKTLHETAVPLWVMSGRRSLLAMRSALHSTADAAVRPTHF